MHALRWLRRTNVFANLSFLDTILHVVGVVTGLFQLLELAREPLPKLQLDKMKVALGAVEFQLHVVVLSAVFGLRNQPLPALAASWWDRIYHVGSLSFHLVMTVFHGMITLYEWQVEQYASSFHHLRSCFHNAVLSYVHELIVTSLIIRNELNLHGVSVNDIQRIEDRAEVALPSCSQVTTEPSIEPGLATEGTPSTQTQSDLASATENLFALELDKVVGEGMTEIEPDTGEIE